MRPVPVRELFEIVALFPQMLDNFPEELIVLLGQELGGLQGQGRGGPFGIQQRRHGLSLMTVNDIIALNWLPFASWKAHFCRTAARWPRRPR